MTIEPSLIISSLALCVSFLGLSLSLLSYRKTHAGELTVHARASATDRALSISIANSGSRPLTVTNIWLGYGSSPEHMQLIADMCSPEIKRNMLSVSQLHELPPLSFDLLQGFVIEKKIRQGYNRRLWIRVRSATGPVADAVVYLDKDLGPNDASAPAWPFITCDLLLGFPRQPERISDDRLLSK